MWKLRSQLLTILIFNYFKFLTFFYIDTVIIQSLKQKHNYSVLMVVVPPVLDTQHNNIKF